ncbi:hypothetical protein [Sphingomonas sp. TREG-RG-20F-R18-01]|uniref:hypothetical protein n=1 Tax=Sphingomonas sp. TREG-RG-20F-R18-01 TaxID=2914982 RepID=UPI001F586E43|nr:hypothetical protein [Sphingomonas sp. TREG-RG-20F-R18-01]
MPDPIIKQFVVEGSTAFPFAMLNSDQCWPARAADATALADHPLDGGATTPRRKIILATAATYAPNRQGWIAGGWRVID